MARPRSTASSCRARRRLVMSAVTAALLAGLPQAVADVSDSQYWHEMYHGWLSMAAYGDYATLCPQQSFTSASLQKAFPGSTEAPWTLLDSWGPTASGFEGFNVIIPEMDKVVMVFKGIYGWQSQWDDTSVNINDMFYLSCPNCQAHAGAVQAYQEAKEATNDWATVKQAVNETGHQWSITGHGFAGMVAQVASLDLGWRGLSHWSHSHGAPRVLNPDSAALFEKLYAGQAGQRTVANEDSLPEAIAESDDYTFVLQGFHVWGTNSTYGMNYEICPNTPDDPNCLGGSVSYDTWYYYTRAGQCGGGGGYNAAALQKIDASISAAYWATATVSQASSTATSSSAAVVNVTRTVYSTSTMTPNVTTVVVPATQTKSIVPVTTISLPGQSASNGAVAAANNAQVSASSIAVPTSSTATGAASPTLALAFTGAAALAGLASCALLW